MSPDSNSAGLTIRRLCSSADPAFEDLLRVYFDAHPQGELKPASALVKMIERPEYFFLALMEGPSAAAFSISICFPNSEAALLEYMAVDAVRRGQGLGTLLFHRTAKFETIAARFLLIEVDSDREASADLPDRRRRKLFYRRLACREIGGLSYIMPRVSSAPPPPMEMLLYRNTLPDSIPKSTLRSWLRSCYSLVYQAPSDDRRIDLMLEPLPADVRLI